MECLNAKKIVTCILGNCDQSAVFSEKNQPSYAIKHVFIEIQLRLVLYFRTNLAKTLITKITYFLFGNKMTNVDP